MSSWFQWFPSNGTVFLWVRTHNARLSLAKAPSSLPQSMMTPVMTVKDGLNQQTIKNIPKSP